MASTIETGFVRNTAKFEKLITICTSFGTSYNPSRENLTIPALSTLLQESKDANAEVNESLANYKNAVAARTAAYKPLSKLITRVQNAAIACGLPTEIEDNLRTVVRKLNGRRAPGSKTPEQQPLSANTAAAIAEPAPAPARISVSQMSVDARLGNLKTLVALLETRPEYTPNEPDLQIESLKALENQLEILNKNVDTALAELSRKRDTRINIINQPNTGLIDVALAVKAYVKSVFGTSNAQAREISKIIFRRPKENA
ncbi:hypothetical protein [Ascidiimonas aurantiaca]|uniref:hypothetical protein n=1 Tax=Ascidiimonas aurantiaca TaxID=1685432 RepID=UPI0030ECB944